MAYTDIATREDLTNELIAHARFAADTEELIRFAESVVIAVNDGELLVLPEAETEREKYNAVCHLLSELQRKFRQHGERPGTDLSISLEVLALNVRDGGYKYRRVLEDIGDMPSISAAG